MEALGVAIGVPGLAALFLKAGLDGYNILTSARNISADVEHYIHSLTVEHQILLDWWEIAKDIQIPNDGKLDSDDRKRYILILNTLARIALSFRRAAEIGSVKAITPQKERRGVRSPGKRVLGLDMPSWLRGTDSHNANNEISLKSIDSSILGMEDNISLDTKLAQLTKLGSVLENPGQSRLTLQGLKWAIADKKKLEELVERLKGYTQDLYAISKPLFAPQGMRMFYG